jgi:hypothetical protein
LARCRFDDLTDDHASPTNSEGRQRFPSLIWAAVGQEHDKQNEEIMRSFQAVCGRSFRCYKALAARLAEVTAIFLALDVDVTGTDPTS